MISPIVLTLLGGTILGWVAHHAHIRANGLKGLDRAFGLPDGTLEAYVNKLEADAEAKAASKLP